MHPQIIRLYEVIETPTNIFVVMEYVKFGELFDYIIEKGRLLEDEARFFFEQVLWASSICHYPEFQFKGKKEGEIRLKYTSFQVFLFP